jgi:hypothetical protein
MEKKEPSTKKVIQRVIKVSQSGRKIEKERENSRDLQ